MGRSRKSDKDLPERVYLEYGKQRKDGSWPKPYYYFKPFKGERIKLGKSRAEMYLKLSQFEDRNKYIINMGDLIDEYMQLVAPKELQSENYEIEAFRARFLKVFFKNFLPDEVLPKDIYEYMDIRSKKQDLGKGKVSGGKVAANKDRSLLSKIFNYAIRKGLLNDNPCANVKPNKTKPRDRYVRHQELQAVYNEGSAVFQCIIDFTYLCGQRRSDNLFIKESEFTEAGIPIIQGKGKGKVKLLIKWTYYLRSCVNRAIKLKEEKGIKSDFLFCKNDGTPYTQDGFKSMFQRAMERALNKGTLKEPFTYHDIRAKTYTDQKDKKKSADLAGHADGAMARVYDRPDFKEVEPLK
jgi:integrase